MSEAKLTRREVIQGGAALVGAAAFGSILTQRAHAATRAGLPFDEYAKYDALGLADLVRRGEVSPEELLEAAIQRTEQVNPTINAVVLEHYEFAREAIRRGLPDGPFRGVPFLLKDLGVHLKGTITTNGSVFFKDDVATYTNTVVKRYQAAGLVIFGKTHSPEFGNTSSSETVLFGATHNPWNLARTAGGSSGGAAAAVAAGILPLANASDGGGSIRIPASCCGLFGMKPTRGRVPLGPPDAEIRNACAVIHCVSRSVRDSAALLDVTQGPDTGDPYYAPPVKGSYLAEVGAPVGKLRIALMRNPLFPFPVDPECTQAVEQAAGLCESLGHHVEEASPQIDVATFFGGFGVSTDIVVLMLVEAREKELGRPMREDEIEPLNRASLERARVASAASYARARQAFFRGGRAMAEFQKNYDVILSPTMARPPQKLGVLALTNTSESFVPAATATSAFTMVYNATGQPAMSVPLHWSADGLPIGVMFAGRFGDEATLYRLAAQLEQAQPWADRHPQL